MPPLMDEGRALFLLALAIIRLEVPFMALQVCNSLPTKFLFCASSEEF